ncbi:MAG: hypothetical protein V3T49_00320 [Dehalococcoidia bacterium]
MTVTVFHRLVSPAIIHPFDCAQDWLWFFLAITVVIPKAHLDWIEMGFGPRGACG